MEKEPKAVWIVARHDGDPWWTLAQHVVGVYGTREAALAAYPEAQEQGIMSGADVGMEDEEDWYELYKATVEG
ncbi:MAG TPA: hypothetical protein VEA41_09880 [Salinarimonas sp.]|nr:hypothetical protein [Salinarimonas sp.]